MIRFKEYEDAVEHLKEQLAEAQSDRDRYSDFDKERRRLIKNLEDKDSEIRSLKSALDEVKTKQSDMENREIDYQV